MPMCTSIAFPERGLYGRNLDLEYHFGEQVVICPRGHVFSFLQQSPLERHYAMIGMANIADDSPLYAEAANEKGLYMAGLYFPGKACYFDKPEPEGLNLAPYELIPMILGSCSTLAQARSLLEKTHLLAVPFKPGYPLAQLHWHIASAEGALVAEPMADGMQVYEDRIGVLTNNPPYPFQLANLNNYRSLSPSTGENSFCPALELEVYGQGLGALGLPGDASPMSRFVRAAFLKSHADFEEQRPLEISQFFHILDGVSMLRGSVITPEGRPDETSYSCCIDAVQGIYYYKTYHSGCICSLDIHDAPLDGSALSALAPENSPPFIKAKPSLLN